MVATGIRPIAKRFLWADAVTIQTCLNSNELLYGVNNNFQDKLNLCAKAGIIYTERFGTGAKQDKTGKGENMNGVTEQKKKVLIVDDSEMNRALLVDMLGEEYEVVEAENGMQAIEILQKFENEFSIMLLDIVMPGMNGFEVLKLMNQYHWIENIPVIMISSESGSIQVERAYELGVTDFISRPFDALIVRRRVVNTILLYAKQKKLLGLVEEQIYEKQKQSNMMIDILSHIVEFRNGESGPHVRHIHVLTELFLRYLVQITDKYPVARTDINQIGMASALHDIGKMGIPSEIVNKPGRLTDEEFAVMKTHSIIGAQTVEQLPYARDEEFVKISYEICRWHHERYDGRGYPDGLKGDEIPISAQAVALADVYDALTSERVYKKAFSHEKAIQMIVNGECGVFNPLLLQCLVGTADSIQEELRKSEQGDVSQRNARNIIEEVLNKEGMSASERTLQLLEHERMKQSFFASMSKEIQFEYTVSPPMLTLNTWGAEKLGLPEVVQDPFQDGELSNMHETKTGREISDAVRSTSPEKPILEYDFQLNMGGELRWVRITSRTIWSTDEPPRYEGVIGKAVDIHETHEQMKLLEQKAFHDGLTGLFNHSYARDRIKERLEGRKDCKFILAILDMDKFKQANDQWGHMFGDQVLIHFAELIRKNIRGGDIAARVGGDEFLIFLEYKTDIHTLVDRIFHSLHGQYKHFSISVSMGVACTEEVGIDYDELFHAADQALYNVKQTERGRYCFYEKNMQTDCSAISSIETEETEGE